VSTTGGASVVDPSASTVDLHGRTTTTRVNDRFASDDDSYGWAEKVPDWPPGYVDPGGGPYAVDGLEHAKYRIACLEYMGFDVTPTVDGLGFVFNASGLSRDAAFALDHECYQRAIDIGLIRDYADTPEGLTQKYEAEMQTQRCLEEHGFRTVDPPTLDAYIDSGGTNWSAFDAYGGRIDAFSTGGLTADQREWVEAESICPPGGG